MYDVLRQIEKQYGSVTEYYRSMDDDKAHEASLREREAQDCELITEAETKIHDFSVLIEQD